MEYFVIGPDGAEYGPAPMDTLKQWVAERRVLPATMLKSVQSGLTVAASTVPELFPLAPQSPPVQTASPNPSAGMGYPAPGTYPRGNGFPVGSISGAGNSDLAWAFGMAAASLAMFFFMNGIGFFFAISSIRSAFRAKARGNQYAPIAIGVSFLALAAVLVGWGFRVSSASSPPN